MAVLQRCAREGGFDTTAGPRDLAGAIARTALSHYIFPDSRPHRRTPADPGRRRSSAAPLPLPYEPTRSGWRP